MHSIETSKKSSARVLSGKASRIFRAQERNKINACLLSKQKELKDREKLIMNYVYLVNWVVNRLPQAALKGIEKEDLIGYGTVGLIEAIDRFDSTRGSHFESFAIKRIRGSIYDQLRATDWLTRTSRKKVKNLSKAITKLEQELGRCPNDSEIAKELSVSLQELRAVQKEAQIGIFSLDATKENYEDSALVDNLPSNSIPALDQLEENELLRDLTKAIDMLPEREKTVISLYHYKKLTFKEIAEVMNFSESRASQLHARAITILKSKLVK